MKKKKIYIILAILLIIFTISIAPKELQNDTFFDIPIGNYILQNGIDGMDHFTWHTDLSYTYSHWLFGVIEAVLYNATGFLGLYVMVIIVACITSFTIYTMLCKRGHNVILSFIITLITVYIARDAFAARAQLITFWLFILEYYFIEKLLETNKKRYSVILLIIPIIIANVHASIWILYFAFYLPFIAEYILYNVLNRFKKLPNQKVIVQKRNIKLLIGTMILAIGTGLLTPLGTVPYDFMQKSMAGVAKEYVTELQPLNIMANPYIIIMLSIFIGIATFTKTKVRLTDAIFLLGFTLMSIDTYRSIFFLLFIGAFILTRIVSNFFKEYEVEVLEQIANNRYGFLLICFITLSMSIYYGAGKLATDFVSPIHYPIGATEYILDNVDIENMRIYNGFDYGSYLELNHIPAFIDSRAEMYCREFNDTTILEDVMSLEEGKLSYQEIFSKYDITHVLIYTSNDVINTYISKDKEYKVLYQDDRFILYEKIK